MNTAQLKTYAPEARKAFIAAVSAQAARLGITAKGIADAQVQGDVLLVGGQAFPQSYAKPRKNLVERVEAHNFEATMEAIAYTWFNRFIAIRYMELHGYFDHGYRVLSHPEGQGRPEILDRAADVDLPGLDRARAVELKLDGTKDEELYRLLLKAQCNALHEAMPFLFERIGDETELLLPANLLHTDSLIRQMVESIDESAWEQIEIIGWLYQFYISEKKDQVIGKVVKSEDIPAATQLFTPNWIVKYMVQNSLGAQWLATYPNSPLKGQMDYYIEPAEQTDEVKAQLKTITPSTLNPEELTLIDPASGSGHILVEAYEMFKVIYLERGYRQRDVARLILEKNLFGLDIDARAAQLTGFALMMKGRADDRRLFKQGVKLNVMALVGSTGFDAERLEKGVELADYGLQPNDLAELKRLFEYATTFGSLIQVSEGLAEKLPVLKLLSEASSQDLFVSDALQRLGPLVKQAELLAAQYDAVVANPPYMGSNAMNPLVKKFAKDHFPDAKSNLFACFIERGYTLAKDAGHNAMVTMQSWMFLSSFQKMRERTLREKTIRTMAHLGARAFGSISGEVVQTTAFVLKNRSPQGYKPAFFRLLDGGEDEKRTALANGEKRFDTTAQDEFKKIPDSPMAYWVPEAAKSVFQEGKPLGDIAKPRQGLATADNDSFRRNWHEVDESTTGFGGYSSGKKWFPYNSGGGFRKWFGNQTYVVNWENDGYDIRQDKLNKLALGKCLPSNSKPKNTSFYFRESVSWSKVTSGSLSLRYFPPGFIFDVAGCSIFQEDTRWLKYILGLLNSSATKALLGAMSATVNYEVGQIKAIPVLDSDTESTVFVNTLGFVQRCIEIAEQDWRSYERSWDFQSLPILTPSNPGFPILESSYTAWAARNCQTIAEMKRLEEENNRLFIDAYGLADELTPDVPIEQITLTVNPAYRYGGKLTEEEQWTRFRQDTMQELVSYAIGCMMGRYSLDAPGLIYAHSGNADFDPSRYTTFRADDDGIIPITDTEWFDDDVAHRIIEFISVAWDVAHLEDNLTFLADNLSPKKNDPSRETIRRYLRDTFFKDHLQTYKKRPIYWLFSSGKQKAFQCLAYLHRYNKGTLSRMRSEYVIPLQGKMAARLEKLLGDIQVATSTAHQKRLEKERAKLEKQQVELLAFDEKLRHYADRRITLDLDDGVKVNYGRFGDLLAEAKTVHGKKPEDV
ncbi:MAG: BREX-1 system adenine-specific DNA-methyltransferase PglX [Candidatus Eisenbacteria sp.]|nr:BREX-1 system adenine-specific DNA-methyltransferase PglX [Candidatus Eisenbacteria bacterium]